MKQLGLTSRMIRLCELERHATCYRNAYIAELEGRKGFGPNKQGRAGAEVARMWQRLLDAMFGILVQEGMVEKVEEGEGDDSEDVY